MTKLSFHFNDGLPERLDVFLRQHVDFDSGGLLRSWVEIYEPPAPDNGALKTFIDRVLASSPRARPVSDELQGDIDPAQLLEQAFQNCLGVWPIPRQGLREDLATLGYRLDWTEDGLRNTITPVSIQAEFTRPH